MNEDATALKIDNNDGGGATFNVRVQPRARRPGLIGLYGDALKVAVGAAPVDGAANAAVESLLADCLGVPTALVTIVRGHTSRAKRVSVTGCDAAEVRRRLAWALRP